MLRLVGLVVVAAFFWSGWWMLMATLTQAGLDFWLSDRRAEGWVADAGEIEVAGYPRDFAVTVSGLELADPETGLAWRAPEFHFTSRAWSPTRIAATWPPEQEIATPEEKITVSSPGMGADLALAPGEAMALESANASVDALTLVSSLGWEARLAEGRLSLVRLEESANRYDLMFHAAALEPGAPLLELVDPRGRLPRHIDLVSLDATVGFDAPWNRYAVERRRPQPVAIDLGRLRARWGELDLEAAGDLAVDPDGLPTGEIQVRAVNWREMIALGEASGLIPPELSRSLESGLELLAAATGHPDTLELPLSFRNGRVSLGPIPLGAAPRLVLR